MKAIEPDFTAVWKEVEANSNKQCLDRSEACYEDGFYESEAAFRLSRAYTSVRYKMVILHEKFRNFCRKKVDNEIHEQEKAQ